MKTKFLIAAAAAVILTGVGVAAAGEDCDARIGDWQPRSAVVKMAEERGWTVQRVKAHHGCYEILCTDKDGRRFEAIVDPATLKVLDQRNPDDEHRHDRRWFRGDDDGEEHGALRREDGRGGRHGDDEDDEDDDDDEGGSFAGNQPAAPAAGAPAPANPLFKGGIRPKVQIQ